MRKSYQLAEGRIVEAPDGTGPLEVFISPEGDEKKYLIETLKIDEHTLVSALDPDEISRLEFEPDHIAVIFKVPRSHSGKDQLLFRVSSVGAFLFQDRLVLLLSEDVPLFNGKQFIRLNSLAGLLLKLINRSIFHFREHLKIINDLSDELEQKINASMENRYLINLFTLGKGLVYYQNAINSNGVLIEKLKLGGQKIGFKTEELEFLDDIFIENNQCYRQAAIYSNILASMMDARVSIVNNNLNILMKTLNIITISLMAPTLVVSIFSMNVALPFQNNPYAYYFIVALACVSVLGFLLFQRYKHWAG